MEVIWSLVSFAIRPRGMLCYQCKPRLLTVQPNGTEQVGGVRSDKAPYKIVRRGEFPIRK